MTSAKLSKSDRVDAGRLATLIAIRNVLAGSASPEDLGVNGAINDVLQTLGLIDSAKTLLSGLEA